MAVHVRAAEANDGKACGRICYRAFATVAERHGFPPDFASVGDATEVVSALIAHRNFFSAVAEEEGTVIGSNFMDVRSSIFSVGPVTVDPLFHNHGAGTELMLMSWASTSGALRPEFGWCKWLITPRR
jgi:hypothetical protein